MVRLALATSGRMRAPRRAEVQVFSGRSRESQGCARTVDLQLAHLPQRARRFALSLSALSLDEAPVTFGAGVSMRLKVRAATRNVGQQE